jgi:N6-L-threonylcarbamoyladenine synthase
VNHIEGHIFANFIQFQALEPPFLSLIVSGGHTHLVYVKDYGHYEILGRTRDDAAGESFDKVARRLGLGYPGGPLIDQLAKEGNSEAIDFPIPYLKDSFDFSFSGLKTAVLNYLNMMRQNDEQINKADVAACFQRSVVEVLVRKAQDALKAKDCKKLALAGGVAANSELRKQLSALGEKYDYEIYDPDIG